VFFAWLKPSPKGDAIGLRRQT